MTYLYGKNLIDDPTGNGFCTEKLLSVKPDLQYPFDRDKTAILYADQYIVHPDCFTPQDVGTPHPSLKISITGTVQIANNSTLMTSSTIDFTEHFLSGDSVYVNGQTLEVSSVLSDQMTLTANYTGLSLTSASIQRAKAYLVSENAFEYDDGGLLRFVRNYATIPDGRTEFATTGFTFPAYRTLVAEDGNPARSSFNRVVVAKEVYSYIRTNDPENDLSITSQFAPLDASGNQVDCVATDTTPTRASYEALVSSGGYIHSGETQITPWQGNIWELKQQQVVAK